MAGNSQEEISEYSLKGNRVSYKPIDLDENAKLTVGLYHEDGRIIKEFKNVKSGVPISHNLDDLLEPLEPGTYEMKIMVDDGIGRKAEQSLSYTKKPVVDKKALAAKAAAELEKKRQVKIDEQNKKPKPMTFLERYVTEAEKGVSIQLGPINKILYGTLEKRREGSNTQLGGYAGLCGGKTDSNDSNVPNTTHNFEQFTQTDMFNDTETIRYDETECKGVAGIQAKVSKIFGNDKGIYARFRGGVALTEVTKGGDDTSILSSYRNGTQDVNGNFTNRGTLVSQGAFTNNPFDDSKHKFAFDGYAGIGIENQTRDKYAELGVSITGEKSAVVLEGGMRYDLGKVLTRMFGK